MDHLYKINIGRKLLWSYSIVPEQITQYFMNYHLSVCFYMVLYSKKHSQDETSVTLLSLPAFV